MTSEHAAGLVQPNQPPNIPEGPSHQNATTSSHDHDPFLLGEGSPSRRQPETHIDSENIIPPPVTHFPLSPTSVDRFGERGSLGRQDSRYIPQDVGAGHFSAPSPGVRLTDNQFSPTRQGTMEGNRMSAAPRSARAVSQVFSGHSGIQNEKTVATVSDRIRTTVENAQRERDKYASKAKVTGLALNVAIGLQVLLGSLTTGLSAVATSGRNAAVSTTILGAFSTIVASYLARARGSNEPELSIARVKDLEQFLRECKNFETDHGHDTGPHFDRQLEYYRARFENLLGNGNEERRMSPA